MSGRSATPVMCVMGCGTATRSVPEPVRNRAQAPCSPCRPASLLRVMARFGHRLRVVAKVSSGRKYVSSCRDPRAPTAAWSDGRTAGTPIAFGAVRPSPRTRALAMAAGCVRPGSSPKDDAAIMACVSVSTAMVASSVTRNTRSVRCAAVLGSRRHLFEAERIVHVCAGAGFEHTDGRGAVTYPGGHIDHGLRSTPAHGVSELQAAAVGEGELPRHGVWPLNQRRAPRPP